jgi:hypothetical protein
MTRTRKLWLLAGVATLASTGLAAAAVAAVGPDDAGTDTRSPAGIVHDLSSTSRIGVADSEGRVRGTIPTEVGLPGPNNPRAVITPVLDDNGQVTGYFLAGVGFVERETVERPGFDAAAYVAQNAKTGPRRVPVPQEPPR